MKSRYLPAVLLSEREGDSISMERALNQIKALLEDMKPETELQEVAREASLDDIEMMINAIRR